MQRLRALILLGGAMRSTPFYTGIGRSALDLPLDAGHSLLANWRDEAVGLANHLEKPEFPVLVLINREAPQPASPPADPAVTMAIQRDPADYRGTGGLLRDLAADRPENDYILVANAAQLLVEPLTDLAESLVATAADVALISHLDGAPGGMMLARCGALLSVPATGFVDMKEQALPAIARRHVVRVVHRRHATALSVRTSADYIRALRAFHQRRAGLPVFSDALAEDWRPAFRVVEKGASVDGSAQVHDSIVLRGGIVHAGAVVVRSIVCPDGHVGRNARAVDEVIAPSPRRGTMTP